MIERDSVSGGFKPAKLEMVRLTIPRRVYTQNPIDYVVECVGKIFRKRIKAKECTLFMSRRC